jgi:lysophospholipase L1-like esterase
MTRTSGVLASAAAAALLVMAGAPTALARPHAPAQAPTEYYLALGDSLSIGIQPGPDGVEHPTDQGYADDLYTKLQQQDAADGRNLQLVKLGCSGETSTTMVGGGICTYPGATSQLDAATQFLAAHRGQVKLVTVDIGANDVDACISATGADPNCVQAGLTALTANLSTITTRIAQADPGTRVVGMNYYDPFLAQWLTGAPGQQLATLSLGLVHTLNQTLQDGYNAAGDPVADTARAFGIDNTSPTSLPGAGQVPRDVATTCDLTWMCAPAPTGPNIHANPAGYATIARAFQAKLW